MLSYAFVYVLLSPVFMTSHPSSLRGWACQESSAWGGSHGEMPVNLNAVFLDQCCQGRNRWQSSWQSSATRNMPFSSFSIEIYWHVHTFPVKIQLEYVGIYKSTGFHRYRTGNIQRCGSSNLPTYCKAATAERLRNMSQRVLFGMDVYIYIACSPVLFGK